MAHDITDTDEVFSVRQPMWHGLGKVLTEYPTRQEAQPLVHGWEPVGEPIYRRRFKERSDGPPITVYEEVPHQVLYARSDDDVPLSVMSDTYTPTSNAQLWDIAEAIEGQDKGLVLYETGGSLLGGRKVWLLLRLRDPLTVVGDPNGAIIPYYALQNSHDGSGAFRGQATLTRIVCANTAQIADYDAQTRGTEFTFRHTSSVHERIAEAKVALAGWRESLETWNRLAAHLVGLKLTDTAQVLFVEKFIPMPDPHTTTDRVVHNVETAREQLTGILRGPTCEGIGHTAYGLVQAATEYLNHSRRARSEESRFKRTYLDRNAIVTDALTLAQELALSS